PLKSAGGLAVAKSSYFGGDININRVYHGYGKITFSLSKHVSASSTIDILKVKSNESWTQTKIELSAWFQQAGPNDDCGLLKETTIWRSSNNSQYVQTGKVTSELIPGNFEILYN